MDQQDLTNLRDDLEAQLSDLSWQVTHYQRKGDEESAQIARDGYAALSKRLDRINAWLGQ